jgi:predicted TIM-barrel fold metal-dependent hydrolase
VRTSSSIQFDSSRVSYVDAHVHLWSADLQKYPLAPGFSRAQMQPPSFMAEELLSLARSLGIGRVVLIQMVFYGFDNSLMLDAIQAYPEVFSGVALVDEQGKNPAEEMRRLKQLGVRGVRITPSQRRDSTWLDSPGMHAMWQCAAEEQMAMCCLINPEDISTVDRMADKFPETPVVVDHCARIGGDGKIRGTDLDHLCKLSQHSQVHVKLSAFYYLGSKQPPYTDLAPMIRRLCDAFGSQRLMWASDSPFQVQPPHTYDDSLRLIRDRLDFLSDTDREWILRGTAEKIFFYESKQIPRPIKVTKS